MRSILLAGNAARFKDGGQTRTIIKSLRPVKRDAFTEGRLAVQEGPKGRSRVLNIG
jgi:hypothetical protein